VPRGARLHGEVGVLLPARRAAPQVGAALLCSAAALAGCGGPTLHLRPGSGIAPYGDWILDPARSEDARAAIAKALPKRELPPPREAASDQDVNGSERRQRSQRNADRNATAQAAHDDNLLPLRVRNALAVSFVMPAEHVRLSAAGDGVELWQGDRHRLFSTLGGDGVSITDRFGTRRVQAGWAGAGAFTVLSNEPRMLNVSETFRLREPDTLELEVAMSAQGMGRMKVRSTYRRALPEDLIAPTDGPPSPGR
jgi:hypothetical protein